MEKTRKHAKTNHKVGIDSEDSNLPSSSDGPVPSSSMAGHNHQQAKLSSDAEANNASQVPHEVSAKVETEDRTHLLGIFPEEIWEMIIDNLDAPKDFDSMLDTSSFFKDLLRTRKMLYLFPKIWEILAVKYERNSRDDSSYNHAITDDDPLTRRSDFKPVIGTCSDCGGERYLQWFSGILNMRSVCRTWSNAIDDYYRRIPQTSPFSQMVSRIISVSHERFGEWNTCVSRFIPHFSQTHIGQGRGERNPFIAATVELDLSFEVEPGPEYQQYLDEMTQTLTAFGRHVWHCSIMAYGEGGTSSALYLKIRELLSLMPNLKTILLDFSPPPFRQQIGYSAEQMTQMRSVINLNSIARMNHLDRLRVDHYSPVPIVNEIIRSISSISLLEWSVPKDCEFEDIQLANVKQLDVHFYTETAFRNFFRSTEQCQLEKLTVDFDHKMFMDWLEMFSVINASVWTRTLTDLTIELPVARENDEMDHIATLGELRRLNLAGVKHLKLKFENFSSLDFILPMSETLETLDVNISIWGWDEEFGKRLHDAAGKDQIINFIGYFQRPLESNIWTLFRNLKRFQFSSWAGKDMDPEGQWTCNWSHSRQNWRIQQQRNRNNSTV